MKESPKINIADLFCGAGGTSTGCILAAREENLLEAADKVFTIERGDVK
jgi:site-specific DNA-cytosine methylase